MIVLVFKSKIFLTNSVAFVTTMLLISKLQLLWTNADLPTTNGLILKSWNFTLLFNYLILMLLLMKVFLLISLLKTFNILLRYTLLVSILITMHDFKLSYILLIMMMMSLIQIMIVYQVWIQMLLSVLLIFPRKPFPPIKSSYTTPAEHSIGSFTCQKL